MRTLTLIGLPIGFIIGAVLMVTFGFKSPADAADGTVHMILGVCAAYVCEALFGGKK